MKENGGAVLFFKAVMLGVVTTVGAGLLLMVCGTLAALGSADPEAFVVPAALAALALSVIAGGIVSGKIGEGAGFSSTATSGVCGLLQVILIFLFTVLPVDSYLNIGVLLRLGIYALVVVLSLMGGVLGRPRSRRRKAYKRRPKRR